MTAASTLSMPSGDGAEARVGEIWRVSGPVVVAAGLSGVRLNNVVRVGEVALPGEVIRLDGAHATIQVYENTSGLRVGDPVHDTGRPLEVELGPGLLGRIFDGTQRPLDLLARDGDDA
jgi:V/A-type H+/Na+-transporting ATPase subunit A